MFFNDLLDLSLSFWVTILKKNIIDFATIFKKPLPFWVTINIFYRRDVFFAVFCPDDKLVFPARI